MQEPITADDTPFLQRHDSLADDIAAGVSFLEPHLAFLVDIGVHLLSAVLILIGGWVIGLWIGRRIQNAHRIDQTLGSFLAGFVRYAIMAIALVTVLAQFGVQTASLLAVLGGAALAVGLALQGTLSNVAAGTMMLILRPFKVGDYIKFANTEGTVRTLGLFGTELSTSDNVYIFAPNGQVWGNDIYNYSRNLHRRQDIRFSISYGDDIGKAMAILQDILDEDVRILKSTADKMPSVMTDSLGDYAVVLLVRFWSLSSDYWGLRWDLMRKVKEGFDAADITMPFPTQLSITHVVESA